MGAFLAGAALAGAALTAGFFASSSELESELSELDESFLAAALGVTVLTEAAGVLTGA